MLCGLSGVGKTQMLRQLQEAGEQVIDLEGLARHRGSAFGSFEGVAQPSHKQFGIALASAWHATHANRTLWIEDEGPFLGSVGIPAGVQELAKRAPGVELIAGAAARCARIAEEFGSQPAKYLIAALERSAARIGTARTYLARIAIDAGQLTTAVSILLPYYDSAYLERMRQTHRPMIGRVDSECGHCLALCRRIGFRWMESGLV